MLTLDDLKIYHEHEYIKLEVTLHGKRIPLERSKLTNAQIRTIFSKKKLLITVRGRKIVLDLNRDKESSLGVAIERGYVERKQWEKIKKQMRESGFSYRSESPWFCVYENGGWNCSWR